MRPLRGSVSRLTMPLRVMVRRFAFALLVFAGVALLIAGKADLILVERARTQIVDIAAPFLDAAARPAGFIQNSIDQFGQLLWVRSENERLRAENARLKEWQRVARRLQRINAEYQQLLNAKVGPATAFVGARVIADSGGPFVRTLLLDAGRRDGIAKGQAVMAADGLIGRIAEVGERSARVLLITDLNSRVPILVENAGYRAILAGDNSGRPNLTFLPIGAQISVGDRIVTSGHGGMFPPGRPIGLVAEVIDGVARVQAYVDWNRLTFVSVLRYDRDRFFAEMGTP